MTKIDKFKAHLLYLQEDLSYAGAQDSEITINGNGVNSCEAYQALQPVFDMFAELFNCAEEFKVAQQKGIIHAANPKQ
jgi:hypothetical protein